MYAALRVMGLLWFSLIHLSTALHKFFKLTGSFSHLAGCASSASCAFSAKEMIKELYACSNIHAKY